MHACIHTFMLYLCCGLSSTFVGKFTVSLFYCTFPKCEGEKTLFGIAGLVHNWIAWKCIEICRAYGLEVLTDWLAALRRCFTASAIGEVWKSSAKDHGSKVQVRFSWMIHSAFQTRHSTMWYQHFGWGLQMEAGHQLCCVNHSFHDCFICPNKCCWTQVTSVGGANRPGLNSDFSRKVATFQTCGRSKTAADQWCWHELLSRVVHFGETWVLISLN